MIRMMIAAPASGSGKTAVACGMLALLKQMNKKTCAFKCGPDYIDPMFHRAVLGVQSYNLDLFLSSEEYVKAQYKKICAGCDAAVCEGVMGFYDGVAGVTEQASAWHVADVLDLPVILVIDPKGASLTLAAQIKGMCSLRKPHHITGVLFNRCSLALFQSLAKTIERESGVPVLGYLPSMEEADFESRHLGLYTAGEVENLAARLDKIAAQLSESVDMERLFHLCGSKSGRSQGCERVVPRGWQVQKQAVQAWPGSKQTALAEREKWEQEGLIERQKHEGVSLTERSFSAGYSDCSDFFVDPKANGAAPACSSSGLAQNCSRCSDTVSIAVARDEAFCFVYQETLDALRKAGAELVWFSPLRDARLPEGICGLYLPGGYPELYAKALSENETMRQSVGRAVAAGLPTVAECGGFLYLGRRLAGSDGIRYPMAGVLPGTAEKQSRLVRFGYSKLRAETDSLLFRAGEEIPAHEFHYWDSTENGDGLQAEKPGASWAGVSPSGRGRVWRCCWVTDSLYAGFPHLYFAGRPELVERFVQAAASYQAVFRRADAFRGAGG